MGRGRSATTDQSIRAAAQHRGRGAARGVVARAASAGDRPEQLRRRVDNLKPGSYIDDIIYAQDSALYRWPDGRGEAVQVYLEPSSSAAGWEPAYVGAGAERLRRVERSRLPVALQLHLRLGERGHHAALEGAVSRRGRPAHRRHGAHAHERVLDRVGAHRHREPRQRGPTHPHAHGRRHAPARDRPRARPQSRRTTRRA